MNKIKNIFKNKKVKKILNSKIVKNILGKYRDKLITKKAVSVLIIIASIFGFSINTEVIKNFTMDDFYRFISQNGGTLIEETLLDREAPDNTGVIEDNEIEIVGDAVSMGQSKYLFTPSKELKTWSEARKNIKYERTRRQIDGTCVFESLDIMNILALKELGLKPAVTEPFIDIDHSYWAYSYKPHEDRGTVPRVATKRFIDEGYPVNLSVQRTPENTKYGTYYTVKNKIDQDVYKFKVKTPLRFKKLGYSVDNLFKELEKDPKTIFRISIANYKDKVNPKNRCVSWYWTETPFVKSGYEGSDFFRKCKITGGHSIAGVPIGIFRMNDNKPYLAIYGSTGNGKIRKVSLDTLRYIVTSWETYSITGDISQEKKEEAPKKKNISQADYNILSTYKIKYGDRGDKVKALQRYLKVRADGIFGNGTRTALKEWQFKQFNKHYSGKYWYNGSIRKFKELNN